VSGATNAALDFLATHPATPQRIQLAISQARKVSAPMVGAADRDSFLNGVEGMIFGDTPDEGYIRGRHFIHPVLGIIFSVPAGFIINNSAAAVIASGPGDLAVRFESVPLPEKIPPAVYIGSGWVSGLDSASIRSLVINGFPAASARAENDRWQFDITVILVQDRVYRFLTAAPRNADSPVALSQAASGNFRFLSAQEKESLKSLRIRVVTVRLGETVATLAEGMQGMANKVELFRIINVLTPTATVSAGSRVKIISS